MKPLQWDKGSVAVISDNSWDFSRTGDRNEIKSNYVQLTTNFIIREN